VFIFQQPLQPKVKRSCVCETFKITVARKHCLSEYCSVLGQGLSALNEMPTIRKRMGMRVLTAYALHTLPSVGLGLGCTRIWIGCGFWSSNCTYRYLVQGLYQSDHTTQVMDVYSKRQTSIYTVQGKLIVQKCH